MEKNVFAGNSSIDFAGDEVTSQNFLAVLKNLSNEEMDLFIYFVDHGGPGVLGFPDDFLYVDDLKKVFLSIKSEE